MSRGKCFSVYKRQSGKSVFRVDKAANGYRGTALLCIRGDTSTQGVGGGGTPKADDSTDKLRECDSDMGEGGLKIRKFSGRH